ncbi:MAG TPA: zinc-binding dehydrogenase, partial [Casimicrobiaceae bacterium]
TVVLHSAAGGVGLIAGQWAKHLGVTVIGTVGSNDKIALAKENGCAHVLNSRDADWPKQVRELTGGQGVPVVYDSIGKDTFPQSLDVLSPRGMFVSFGSASGPIAAFDIGLLAQKGSLFATRPTLFTYAATRPALLAMAEDMFKLVAAGKIKSDARQRFALKDAAAAHRALESRGTTGATVLIP